MIIFLIILVCIEGIVCIVQASLCCAATCCKENTQVSIIYTFSNNIWTTLCEMNSNNFVFVLVEHQRETIIRS